MVASCLCKKSLAETNDTETVLILNTNPYFQSLYCIGLNKLLNSKPVLWLG